MTCSYPNWHAFSSGAILLLPALIRSSHAIKLLFWFSLSLSVCFCSIQGRTVVEKPARTALLPSKKRTVFSPMPPEAYRRSTSRIRGTKLAQGPKTRGTQLLSFQDGARAETPTRCSPSGKRPCSASRPATPSSTSQSAQKIEGLLPLCHCVRAHASPSAAERPRQPDSVSRTNAAPRAHELAPCLTSSHHAPLPRLHVCLAARRESLPRLASVQQV